MGVATWDNRDVLPLVDVLSCHSYATGVEAFRADLTGTRNQARAAGKPWIVSECCNPAAGSTYEMALPVLRELDVGHTVWQLIIGRDQFNAASGLVYPDGTVRRIAQVEAVMNARADGFDEKPDEQGLPLQHDIPVLQARYFEALRARRRDRSDLARAGHAGRVAVGAAGRGGPEVEDAREAVAAARKRVRCGRPHDGIRRGGRPDRESGGAVSREPTAAGAAVSAARRPSIATCTASRTSSPTRRRRPPTPSRRPSAKTWGCRFSTTCASASDARPR